MIAKFNLGHTYLTRGVNDSIAESLPFAKFVTDSMHKHAQGDWGNVGKEDRLANERALIDGSRLFSAYAADGLPGIWIITESDRTATTVLFPSEY